MAFLRFSRDKRGYENFYLVETSTSRRGRTRARVLYWFRTPPGVKVGREPFDADVRRALEAQNPNVVFDWRKISETPIPSADAEKWRERRRLERAERTQRRTAAPQDDDGADADVPIDGTPPDEIPDDLSSSEEMAEATGLDPDNATGLVADDAPGGVAPEVSADVTLAADEAANTVGDTTSDIAAPAAPTDSSRRKRRRRRRRGGHRRPDNTVRARPENVPAASEHQESKESSGGGETADSGGPNDPDEV